METMNLQPEDIRLIRDDSNGLQLVIDGVFQQVGRVSRAFPKTNPNHYIGLQDPTGHEMCMIEDPQKMDEESRALLDEELRALYFVPTILEIRSVERKGAGRILEVQTDVGERTFRFQDRNALDGSKAPAITITDESLKRYRIEDYWGLDRESQKLIQDLLPRKVLQLRDARRFW